MSVTIIILIILLILFYLRKSRLQESNAILTDSYLTPYTREANAELVPFIGPPGAPTAFNGRVKNMNAQIPSQ
jgi:hypothetical protein